MVIIPAILLILLFFIFLQKDDKTELSTTELITTIPEEPMIEQQMTDNEEPMIERIMVDVKGAVQFPGVYELTTEDRVVDAVQEAGGYVDGAQTDFINHAQKLQDEMIIYIPRQGEQLEQLETIGQAVQFPTSSTSSTKESGKVNVNRADEIALTTLPGIGPSKAQAILAYREENGSFQSIDDLKNVSGIGEKTFERLKDLIDVK